MPHPNNPFYQNAAETGDSRISGVDQQDIDAVFQPSPVSPVAPTIQIEEAPAASAAAAAAPTLPSRPSSQDPPPPQLPSRPVSPALPARPTSTRPNAFENNGNELIPSRVNDNTDDPQNLDVPSPAYTPVASPNEHTIPPQPTSEIPALDLTDDTTSDQAPPLPPPPPYSEAPAELHDQIFTAPFSNTGGHSPSPSSYHRPVGPPPGHHYTRPAGPPPMSNTTTTYQRPMAAPPVPPQRPSGARAGYPGAVHATYGNAAYNANQPPLPPRH